MKTLLKKSIPLTFLVYLLLWFSAAGGVVNTTRLTLPNGLVTACEHRWTVRLLHYHPSPVTPRRMYFAAGGLGTASAVMCVSLTAASDNDTAALVLQVPYNQAETRFENRISSYRHLTDFNEGHGIAISQDGSAIGMLARRPYGTSTPGTYDKDCLIGHPGEDWMTAVSDTCAEQQVGVDQMWLLEWTGGNIQADPGKYIVHKSIGSWEYGNNYLLLGENDNSYAIALKAMKISWGNCSVHEADAFLIMDRSTYTLTSRGWTWACGTGHTIQNRPAYQPGTKKYAMLCSTDYNSDQTSNIGTTYMHPEGLSARAVHLFNVNGLRQKGGNTTLHPLEDGSGYIGVVVGINGKVVAVPGSEMPVSPPASIGVVTFDKDGILQGSVKWVVTSTDTFYSYPQLTPLGNGHYLLGYGAMYAVSSGDNWSDHKYRIPGEFYLQELNAAGVPITSPMALDSIGWGEQDQMVPLGGGRVAWAYVPDPKLRTKGVIPVCASPVITLHVYKNDSNKANKPLALRRHIIEAVFRPGEGLFISLSRPGPVTLELVDSRGTVWSQTRTYAHAGTHRIQELPPLASGIYHYRLRSAGELISGRLLILT